MNSNQQQTTYCRGASFQQQNRIITVKQPGYGRSVCAFSKLYKQYYHLELIFYDLSPTASSGYHLTNHHYQYTAHNPGYYVWRSDSCSLLAAKVHTLPVSVLHHCCLYYRSFLLCHNQPSQDLTELCLALQVCKILFSFEVTRSLFLETQLHTKLIQT